MESNRRDTPDLSRSGARSVWAAVGLSVGLCALLTWPIIFSGYVRGRGAFDQLNYHEQAVRRFAEQLPHPDLSNYLSATTPGYHLVLAAVARLVSDQRWVLQLAGSLFTLALVGLLTWAVGRGGTPHRTGNAGAGPSSRGWGAVLLVLPFMLSMAVFHSGVWMLPDNAGWLGVLGVWMLALRPRFDWVTVVLGGLVLAALVFVRQIHLWPWAMLLTAAWLGSRPGPDAEFDFARDLRELTEDTPRRLGRTGLALAAGIPAVLVVLAFWKLWGGSLTPPVFTQRHVGGNPAAPAFVLAIFGVYSVPFIPFILDGLRQLWVRHTWLLGTVLVASLALALAFPTSRSYAEGRYSGLWEIARQLPAPGGRSVLIVALDVLGGVTASAWFVSLARRDRWIMLAALVAFTAAQGASFQLWQRYTEPLVLMWLALAASRVAPARSGAGEGWRALGPIVLAGALAAVTLASIVLGRPVTPRALLFPGETRAPILPGMLGPVREDGDRGHPGASDDRSGVEAPEGRSGPEH